MLPPEATSPVSGLAPSPQPGSPWGTHPGVALNSEDGAAGNIAELPAAWWALLRGAPNRLSEGPQQD